MEEPLTRRLVLRYITALTASALTLAALYTPANADSTAQALTSFEFTGTWSQNCAAPPIGDVMRYRQWWNGTKAMLTVSHDNRSTTVEITAREITDHKIVVSANDLQPPFTGQSVMVFTKQSADIRAPDTRNPPIGQAYRIMLTDFRLKGTRDGKDYQKILVYGGLWRWDDAIPGDRDMFAGSPRAETGWMDRCGN
jgi:hypothetical protein